MQLLHRRTVGIARPAPWLEQKKRLAVKRHGIEIVGIPLGELLHRVGVRPILINALGRIELLHVAHGQGVDERLLLGRCAALQRDRLLQSGIRQRRIGHRHLFVQIRAERPGFAPVTDRALRIALPRFAKRPYRLRLGEGVHHLKALREKRLGLGILRGDRAGERPEADRVQLDRIRVPRRHRRCHFVLGQPDGWGNDEQDHER